MVNEETYRQLVEMKLHGMAQSFREYLDQPGGKDGLSFVERFGMMVDREWSQRQERRLKYRLTTSKLREPACLEDVNYKHPRSLDRSVMQRLGTCRWVKEHENVLVTGSTGLGKTWLACALAQKACRDGYTALYARVPRLLHDLFLARGTGTYPKMMDQLAKPDVLLLDDFGLAPLSDLERRDFLELVEERQGRRSTIVTSQLLTKHWHEVIGEPTIADAVLDRLLSSAHRIDLTGESMRPKNRKDK